MNELKEIVVKGPDPKTAKVVRWRCVDLRDEVERRFGVRVDAAGPDITLWIIISTLAWNCRFVRIPANCAGHFMAARSVSTGGRVGMTARVHGQLRARCGASRNTKRGRKQHNLGEVACTETPAERRVGALELQRLRAPLVRIIGDDAVAGGQQVLREGFTHAAQPNHAHAADCRMGQFFRRRETRRVAFRFDGSGG